MSLLVFLAIFFPTLYFDSAIGFFGFSFYGLVAVSSIYMLISKGPRLAAGDWARWVLFCLIVAVAALLSAQFHAFSGSAIKNLVVVATSSFAALALIPLFEERGHTVAVALRWAIVLHAAIFCAQLLMWYGAGIDIDVGGLLGGAGHRSFYTNNIYRATGVYDEPALYGIFMLALCVCLYIYEQKISWPLLLGLFTLPLTLSMASLALFALVVTLLRPRLWLWIIGGLIILAPLSLDFPVVEEAVRALSDRLSDLGQHRDGSTQYKSLVLGDWASSLASMLFGFGLEGYRPEVYPEYYEAMFDVTLPGSNLTGFGLLFGIPALLVFYSFFLGRVSWKVFLLFAVLSIKLSLYHLPFLWLVVALLLAHAQRSSPQTVPSPSSQQGRPWAAA